jgi:nicotinamidase-related amidase
LTVLLRTPTSTGPDFEEIRMTNLSNRPHAALVVIDVQKGVVANATRRDEVVRNISTLVDKARAEDVPVIWVQHNSDDELPRGSEQWHYVDELQREEGEPLVHKRYGDSFEDTELESELAARGVGRLVVAGAQTDACVRSTLHGAFTRGYDTVLVGDAHTTEDLSAWGAPPPDQVISHTNLYWSWQAAPGRTAGVVDTSSVSFDT